ncbi:MAG TPA: hypothetical protein VJT08_03040 [Terriglobales bacterium]|nr:hypothetical protein [Terriglobales bacterium]
MRIDLTGQPHFSRRALTSAVLSCGAAYAPKHHIELRIAALSDRVVEALGRNHIKAGVLEDVGVFMIASS